MTFQEFDKFMDKLYRDCKDMRSTKGKEYAHDADRFANFRRIAKDLELTDLQVAYVYFKKHLDSVISFIKDGKTYSTEPIRGRFTDLILYAFLMAGMAEERGTSITFTRHVSDDMEAFDELDVTSLEDEGTVKLGDLRKKAKKGKRHGKKFLRNRKG